MRGSATAFRRSDAPSGQAGGSAQPAPERPDTAQALAGLLLGLQCVGRAAVVVDGHGEIVGTNPLARPIVEMLGRAAPSRPGVRVVATEHGIRDLVDAALRPSRGAEDVAAVVDVPRGGRVIVRATDMRALAPGLFAEPRVLLDMSGLGHAGLPTPALLRRMLGLTATEAEVAVALARGATASAIARDRAVSLETVRSHLKTIFAKTGTRRQAALVALVLQLRGVSSPG